MSRRGIKELDKNLVPQETVESGDPEEDAKRAEEPDADGAGGHTTPPA